MPNASAKRARTLALALILTPLLAACATTTGSGDRSRGALCDQFQAIRWAVADTAETIRQAKAHNAVGVALCGWKGSAR